MGEPPLKPSLSAQRDALKKGLGRIFQWARSGVLDRDCLLEACLVDLRFDQQIDDCRGHWLWNLVETAGLVADFRARILAGLHDLSDGRSANQLCELAFHYAKAGDLAFKTRLHEIIQTRPIPDSPWLGEYEVVALDEMEGLNAIARVRGAELATRDWEWDDASVVEEATEKLGLDQIQAAWEAASDSSIRRFRDKWIESRSTSHRVKSPTARERASKASVEDIVAIAESEDRNLYLLRVWGTQASDMELNQVFERLLATSEFHAISKYLMVFSNRPMPRIDLQVLDWCRHADAQVRQRAFSALAQCSHPDVRAYALSTIADNFDDGSVIALFIKNYVHGDELFIQKMIKLPEDECDLHGLLMDVLKVLEKNPLADASALALLVYSNTPCVNCRYGAVKLLLKQNCAPPWLLIECCDDAEEDIRKKVTSE